jgi:hypothetical protein
MAKNDTPPDIHWLAEPEAHNYPAALSYLSLVCEPSLAEARVQLLRDASMTVFKSKDIFRASGLSLLGVSNSHVKRNTDKIEDGKALSPILLVRDTALGRVIVADGYHRLCAVYQYHEDAEIPCKIV